jgi:hypothetical protein
MYLNLQERVLAVDFTSGKLIGTSPSRNSELHPHLVGLSQFALLALQVDQNTAQFVGYNFGPMDLLFNFTVNSGAALDVYSISGNWENEVLVPTSSGFYFIFGGAPLGPSMNGVYANFLAATGGPVGSNTWVTHNRAFITSDNSVMAFSFTRNG